MGTDVLYRRTGSRGMARRARTVRSSRIRWLARATGRGCRPDRLLSVVYSGGSICLSGNAEPQLSAVIQDPDEIKHILRPLIKIRRAPPGLVRSVPSASVQSRRPADCAAFTFAIGYDYHLKINQAFVADGPGMLNYPGLRGGTHLRADQQSPSRFASRFLHGPDRGSQRRLPVLNH